MPEPSIRPGQGLFTAPIALGAMRPAELAAVIERPAALAGMALEAGLVPDMVEDVERR